jgi:hypothetical protein
MNNKIFNKSIIFFVVLLVSTALPVFAEGPAADYEVPVGNLSEQRVDIQSVIMAITYNMQGAREQGIGPVMFDENFGHLDDGTGLIYRDFKLVGVAITKDISLLDDEKYRELCFILEFIDPGLRSAFVDVTVNYYLGKELIFVEQAEASPLYLDRGNVQFYYLPSKDLVSISDMTDMSYPEIAEMISEHALTRDELKELPDGRMNRLRLVAIHQCRVASDGRLSLAIQGDDAENLAVTDRVKEWNIDGWPITVADGFFILNTEPGFLIEVSKYDISETGGKTSLLNRFPSIFQ